MPRYAILCIVAMLFFPLLLSAESIDAKVSKAIKELQEFQNVDANAEIIRSSNISGDALYKKLVKRPKYSDKEKKGLSNASIKVSDDCSLLYAYNIPASYNPSKPMPIMFILHGGVSTPEPIPLDQLYSSMAGSYAPILSKFKEGIILVAPQGSAKSLWWTANGSRMVLTALRNIKRKFNVDTNRAFVTGFSDGGSGSFFNAAFNATYFAAAFPMNGMLSNANGGGYSAFIESFRNRPIFICNTTEDTLYPPKYSQPFADALKDGGVETVFKMFPNIPHRFDYAPQIADEMAEWLTKKHRDPWAKKIEFATADPKRHNRVDWLEIIELGNGAYTGIMIKGEGGQFLGSTGGYVKATRDGNSFTVEAVGVKKLRIALSPAVVSFDKPIIVTVNEKQVFEGAVEMDAKDVLESWLRDEDEHTLAGKLLEIEIGE